MNLAPNRYISGVLHGGSHPASPIQVAKFSERPFIVPPEVRNGLNAVNRTLSPNLNVLSLSVYAPDQTVLAFS